MKSDIDGSAVISALAARVTALADRITGELTVAQGNLKKLGGKPL